MGAQTPLWATQPKGSMLARACVICCVDSMLQPQLWLTCALTHRGWNWWGSDRDVAFQPCGNTVVGRGLNWACCCESACWPALLLFYRLDDGSCCCCCIMYMRCTLHAYGLVLVHACGLHGMGLHACWGRHSVINLLCLMAWLQNRLIAKAFHHASRMHGRQHRHVVNSTMVGDAGRSQAVSTLLLVVANSYMLPCKATAPLLHICNTCGVLAAWQLPRFCASASASMHVCCFVAAVTGLPIFWGQLEAL